MSRMRSLAAALAAMAFCCGLGAQAITMSYNGTTVPSGGTVYINPCLQMGSGNTGIDCLTASGTPVASPNFPEPAISFSVSSPYNQPNYAVSWALSESWQDECKGSVESGIYKAPNPCHVVGGVQVGFVNGWSAYQGGSGQDVPGNEPWVISWNGVGPLGGTVVVSATIYSQCNPPVIAAQPSATFYIWGANPTKNEYDAQGVNANEVLVSSAMDNAVGGTPPWYLHQIMVLESDQEEWQFFSEGSTQGWPRWGSPDGIGLMQIDRTQNPQLWEWGGTGAQVDDFPYWDYITSIADGWSILQHDATVAQGDWVNQVSAMCTSKGQSYLNGGCSGGYAVDTQTSFTCATGPSSQEPISASFPQAAGTVSPVVANLIAYYNTGSADFIKWGGSSWSIPTNTHAYAYVRAVCGEAWYYAPPGP